MKKASRKLNDDLRPQTGAPTSARSCAASSAQATPPRPQARRVPPALIYFFSNPLTNAARAVAACISSEKSEPLKMSCTPIAMWRSRSSAV